MELLGAGLELFLALLDRGEAGVDLAGQVTNSGEDGSGVAPHPCVDPRAGASGVRLRRLSTG